MTEAEKKQSGYEILYLSVCALKGIKPAKKIIDKIDFQRLLKICRSHSLSGIVAFALESAGISNSEFETDKNNAIRKTLLLDTERSQIVNFFEGNGIWYMPLKGVYMKEYYPRLGMRQMCDNDILVDSTRINEINDFMLKRGYKVKGMSANDIGYLKEPIYNFEMHVGLIPAYTEQQNWYDYYKTIKEKLVKNDGDNYGFHFTDEDFYIFMITHECKHYRLGGTGLRSLIDSCVYLKKFEDHMDWDYIEGECKKLGIYDYEIQNRCLAKKIFSSPELPELSESEREMLEYYLFSGTYGNFSNEMENKLKDFSYKTGSSSKFKYILYRVFPPMEFYKIHLPFFYRHKLLLPIGWTYRIIKGFHFRSSRIKGEFDYVRKSKKK